MTSKIRFGLRNVHYSVITDTGSAITYGTPVRIPGAVSVSLTANGEIAEFFADDIVYWGAESNNGYDGDLEIADLPETFASDVLGQTLSANGLIVENSDARINRFALTFEVQGDVEPRRYVLYNCIATRPTIASTTRGTTTEPQTSTLTLQARAHPYNRNIKANSTATTTPEVYAVWNTAIVEPTTV